MLLIAGGRSSGPALVQCAEITNDVVTGSVAVMLFPSANWALCRAAGDVAEPPQAAQKAAAAGKGSVGLLSSTLAPALRVRSAETWVEWALPGLGPWADPSFGHALPVGSAEILLEWVVPVACASGIR